MRGEGGMVVAVRDLALFVVQLVDVLQGNVSSSFN